MGKNKLARFEENRHFTNLFQHTDYDIRGVGFPMKGKWHEQYFHNNNPIVLELGCGKGEYTLGLAARYPDKNFIGIDRKGARLWRGCKDAFEQQVPNVAFIRTKIDDIAAYFDSGEVSEIWVTFPDPQPKKERRRLVSPNFVSRYRQVISENGKLHLKTDSRELYEYYLETIAEQGWNLVANVEDVYAGGAPAELTEIQTFYEKMWLAEGKKISYICADNLFEKNIPKKVINNEFV